MVCRKPTDATQYERYEVPCSKPEHVADMSKRTERENDEKRPSCPSVGTVMIEYNLCSVDNGSEGTRSVKLVHHCLEAFDRDVNLCVENLGRWTAREWGKLPK